MDEMKHYLLKSLMLLAAMAMSAGVSAYDFEADGFYFNVLSEADGTVEVTYNKDKPYELFGFYDLPMRVTHDAREYTVVAVGDSAFYYNDNSGGGLVLPDSVVKIGEMSFGLPYNGGGYGQIQFMVSTGNPAFVSIDCGLYSKDFKVLYHYSNQAYPLYIPDDLEEIGSCALAGCWDIDSLSLPNTLKKIGNRAFYKSSLKHLTIPSSLESIGTSAFYETPITSVLLPDAVREIGDSAFYNCSFLTELRMSQSLEKLGMCAFEYCSINTPLKLPETLTEIPYSAFGGCYYMPSVHIPNSVTFIGGHAFHGCGFTELDIPNSVISIGRFAFNGLTKLKSVYIPSSVTHIGAAAFSSGGISPSEHIEIIVDQNNPAYTSIDGVLYDKDVTRLICCPGGKSEISIPNTVKIIDENAFAGCHGLESVQLPSSVVTIGRAAFAYTSGLKRVGLPASLENIDNLAFYYSGIESIELPDMMTEIKDSVFSCCRSLVDVRIPDSVTSIGEEAFYFCYSLRGISLPVSVTEIGRAAFKASFRLASIDLPASLMKIGGQAFDGCDSLNIVRCQAMTPPEAADDTFMDETYSVATLIVPDGARGGYEVAEVWCNFLNIEESDFSGIDEAAARMDMTVTVEDGTLVVSGLPDDVRVGVYTVGGQLVYVGRNRAIDVPGKGVYIIRAGNSTAKIVI